ncbi:fatty acid cis/trans isomerase [Thalassolituus sp. LLYu03]|uniref:fatty acid cis/trans isomerase n=1 Tax=Thalassolituus sp. LLYu03 TaxID=3421656 RepID=UPI003D288ADC
MFSSLFSGRRGLRTAFIAVLLSGCASAGLTIDYDALFGTTQLSERKVADGTAAAQRYHEQIQPILENRCVVCHGCYDAPCQLKLSSPDGIQRGASKALVYDGTRILAAEPSRLGIDATSTAQWREKGFFSVLNERTQTADINMRNSVLYRMLALKANNPLPDDKILDDDDFSLGLNRPQQCPTIEEFDHYENDNPLWGMPYALPAISEQEYQTLTAWIRDGAPMAADPALTPALQQQVNAWEHFLNLRDNQHQLTARYIYEHLFLASLYFSDEPLFTTKSYGLETSPRPSVWFKLIRSSTPPGQPVVPVASRRPYDDPGVQQVYYRLIADHSSVVAKTHMPYQLSAERLQWINELFIRADYDVLKLPDYSPDTAANPFVAFADLPIAARYRFMLQEAEFTIMGFIKGPVCRGQVALNVIDDHFWTLFVDPEKLSSDGYANFLRDQSEHLRLPGEAESNAGIVGNWLQYSWLHNEYLDAKNAVMAEHFPDGKQLTLDLIWAGDQKNPNAALTIFRHFDSSTVVQGLVGQEPKTLWLVDYSLLERIHYLLVAEFDVYGNIGHQLMTRLYMDFLRMEGEYNFLTLLPQQERIRLADFWYRDTSERVRKHLVNYEEHVLSDPNIDYRSAQPKDELVSKIEHYLQPVLSDKYTLATHATPAELAQFARINRIRGEAANLMPELSMIMLEDLHGDARMFTLIRNSGHSNLTGLLYEEDNRLPEEDYLTLVPGILGAYPSAYFRLSSFRLSDFATALTQLEDEGDYEALMDRFGVRRTDPHFWANSDDVQQWYQTHDPLNAGILDYNRLENR